MNEDETLLGDVPEDIEAAPLPSQEELAEVVKIAQRQIMVEDEIADLQERMTAKNLELKTIRETTLPLALTEMGLEGLPLRGGFSIKLREIIAASITKDNQAEAHAWLDKTNNGALIKRTITVQFGKGEEAWANKFMADLRKRKKPLKYDLKEGVNTQTLGAFVREQVRMARAAGADPAQKIPFDLLGVYIAKVTDVERPKAKV